MTRFATAIIVVLAFVGNAHAQSYGVYGYGDDQQRQLREQQERLQQQLEAQQRRQDELDAQMAEQNYKNMQMRNDLLQQQYETHTGIFR
jgi:septal ring factor EnvC (AmiA/AmiB activator)